MTRYDLKIKNNKLNFIGYNNISSKKCIELITHNFKDQFDIDYVLSKNQLYNLINTDKGRHVNVLLQYFVEIQYCNTVIEDL